MQDVVPDHTGGSMKTRIAFVLFMVFLATLTISAQRGGAPRGSAPRANQGHIPPPPPARSNPRAAPDVESDEAGYLNGTPHVNNNHWYGHDRPADPRYHLAQPFVHGRFDKFGPSYRYEIARIDRDHHRFWLPGGFFFEVALWDWPICTDWCWDCGDDYVIYEDSDHIGWYLLYNVDTGVYVHVQYLGT